MKTSFCKLPRDWNECLPENAAFERVLMNAPAVDKETFESAVNVHTIPGMDDNETIDRFLETDPDTRLAVTGYKGQVIAMLQSCGQTLYFTPGGVLPEKIPEISATPAFIRRVVNTDPFSVGADELAGRFVAHGTDAQSALNLVQEGMDLSRCFIGNMGKALYTTTEFQLARRYGVGAAADLGRKDGAVVLIQILPGAKILTEQHDEYDELAVGMGYADFPSKLKKAGYDGIFTPCMSLVAIHNPEAIMIIGACAARDLFDPPQMSQENEGP